MAVLDDMKVRLTAAGIIEGSTDWEGVEDFMPDSPDTVVGLFPTGGPQPELSSTVRYPTFQVRVRGEASSAGYQAMKAKMEEVYQSLLTLKNETVNSVVYAYVIPSSEVTEFINIANLIITEVLGSSSLSSDTLTEIERWLTAHFASAWDQRLVSEKIGDSAVVYQYVKEKGIKSTDYGQRAMLLDTTGLLARLGGPKATFFTQGVSIT